MSVYGEYSRALENAMTRVEGLSDVRATEWSSLLAAARVESHGDLSTAARSCLDALARLDEAWRAEPGGAPAGAGAANDLRGAIDHLLAHCRAVLGLSD